MQFINRPNEWAKRHNKRELKFLIRMICRDPTLSKRRGEEGQVAARHGK